MESGLTSQASPQVRGGLGLLSMLRMSPTQWMGRGALALLAAPEPGPPGSTLFHSPGMGVGRSHVLSPGPYLGLSYTVAGQPLGTGGVLGAEGTVQVPPVATVMTSAPSTTTDQSPVKKEARPLPQ